MPTEVVQNLYVNYGILGCVVVAFFVLLWWVVKTSKEREDKLYIIIETLSKELPEIRKNLEEIKDKLFDD
nr:MAG TPA: holin family protein [Bacteriophage sp.]